MRRDGWLACLGCCDFYFYYDNFQWFRAFFLPFHIISRQQRKVSTIVMQNENKYVPPALRGAGAIQQQQEHSQQGYREQGGNREGFSSASDSFRSGAGGRGPSNSRWNNDGGYNGDENRGYSSNYGDRQSGGGGGRGYSSGRPQGGSSYYSGGARKNELGFHGDQRPNPRVEQELFHTNESQSAGINFDRYDNIPVEVSKGCPEPYNEFTIETIGVQLLKNLVLTKYTKPTPVQKYSIPIGLNGGDLMACAQTGSGKTAGFLFPLIALMIKYGAHPEPESRRGKSSYITSLVLAPTRELAMQIFEEAQKFCYCTGIRPVVVYGGANIQLQQRELDQGADILVATPGRLVDLIERGRVKLDIVRYLVLDEADRMLDMGFEPQIRRIVQEEGMPLDRQTFMFSATFPVEIQRLAGDFMKEYIFLAVGRVGAASKDVTQRVEWVEQNDKVDFVIDFLSRVPEGLVLIFVETKRGADHLEQVLMRSEFPASSIHGDKSQREREDALKMFKTGVTPILVATDVAARGLDIPNVTQVINFDLPSNVDDYVHRIGRTGRVGNVGNALSLMNDKNRNIAKDLAELLSEGQQELPTWLSSMGFGSGGGRGGKSGGRGGGRGGSRFGAKDYRREQPDSSTSGSGRGSGGGRGSVRPAGGPPSGGPRSFAPSGPPMPYGASQGGRFQQEQSWGGFSDNSAW